MGDIIIFMTSRWVILGIFVIVIIIGGIISIIEKLRGKSQEEDELDHMIATSANMNRAPWHEAPEDKDRKKGKIESFYTGKMSRWSNMKTIIYREQQMMREQEKEMAERKAKEGKDKKEETSIGK